MPEPGYAKSFEAFLACTNEKQQLFEYLDSLIRQRGAESLLDIGPGNGDLSIPLSRLVQKYQAIEPIPAYVERLRQQGLNVEQGSFPIQLAGTYDIVLASHVVSFKDTSLEPFIEQAWKQVAEQGILVIITHQGGESDWSRLSARLGKDNLPYHQAVFARLLQLLEMRAAVYQHKIITTVESNAIEQIWSALGFVWSDGRQEGWQDYSQHRNELLTLLETEYKQGDRYVFPFEHTVLMATRRA
jgi:SAM-dependent methyltransferase